MSRMSAAAGDRAPGRRMLDIFMVLTLAFLILPILVIVPLSFSDDSYLRYPPTGWGLRWYRAALAEPRWLQATWNSFAIAIPVAAISAVLGTLAALSVARTKAIWGKLAAVMVMAPMMLPHIILAIGIYPVIVDLRLSGTLLAPIIGHTVIGIPFVFITVWAALRNYDFHLELTAMTLGARPFTTFRRVTLPMIAPSLISGGLLAFVASFDELLLALFLTGPRTETLPRLIWDQLAYSLTPTIAAVASFVFSLSLLLLLASIVIRGGLAAAAANPTANGDHK